MALEDDKWLIETCEESGSAFALELGPGGRLHHERSDYQTIEVYDTAWFGRALVIDGFLMLTERDNLSRDHTRRCSPTPIRNGY